jgi:hypothetical protein
MACGYVWMTAAKTFCPNCSSNRIEDFPQANAPPQQIDLHVTGPVIKKKMMANRGEFRLHTDGISHRYMRIIERRIRYDTYVLDFEYIHFTQITHASMGRKHDILQLYRNDHIFTL